MKKIKPIAAKHRFLRWIKRLLGIQSPSGLWTRSEAGIDEMHLMPCHLLTLEQVKVSADVIDDHLDGLPLTEAEWRARLQRDLAEKLAHEIIEKELYTIIKHEDMINFKTHYRASVTILTSKKEDQDHEPTA